MSSYLMMGLPGLAYLSGVTDVGWTIIGLAVEPTSLGFLWQGGCAAFLHPIESSGKDERS